MPNLNHIGSPALIQWQGQNRPDQAEPIPFLLTDKIFEGSKLLRYFMDRKLLFGEGSTFCIRASAMKKISLARGIDM